MAMSRRTMIAAGLSAAGVVALGAVAASLGGPAPSRTVTRVDAVLRRSRFAPLIGTRFTADANGERFELTLVSVDDLTPVYTPEDEDRFNLLFSALADEPPAGIYTLQHPDAESATLFLSAIGRDGPARRLQALVDRSV